MNLLARSLARAQPTALQHYLYYVEVGSFAFETAIGNIKVGLTNDVSVFTGKGANITDNIDETGAVSAASMPYRPTYLISQPASCKPLDLSCPLYPSGAAPVSNTTFVATTRPWFQLAAAAREPTVTSVYWFGSGGFGLSTVMPFYGNQTRLQAPLRRPLPWYNSAFAPSPAPASSQLQSVAAIDVHLEAISVLLFAITSVPQVPPGSTVIYIVETATGYLVASSSTADNLAKLPPGCTTDCIDNCCRVSATNSDDPVIATSAVPYRAGEGARTWADEGGVGRVGGRVGEDEHRPLC